MKSKEEFKSFVKKHPELIKYVKSGEMNWQKFYELYNLYDEDDSAWNEYINNSHKENNSSTKNTASNFSVSDFMNMFKGIKPEVLQQNINSIQKFLGFVSDFVGDIDNVGNISQTFFIITGNIVNFFYLKGFVLIIIC